MSAPPSSPTSVSFWSCSAHVPFVSRFYRHQPSPFTPTLPPPPPPPPPHHPIISLPHHPHHPISYLATSSLHHLASPESHLPPMLATNIKESLWRSATSLGGGEGSGAAAAAEGAEGAAAVDNSVNSRAHPLLVHVVAEELGCDAEDILDFGTRHDDDECPAMTQPSPPSPPFPPSLPSPPTPPTPPTPTRAAACGHPAVGPHWCMRGVRLVGPPR